MNLLLLFPDDFISPDIVRLTDHRFEHLHKIKKLSLNDTLDAGLINNKTGHAKVIGIDTEKIELQVCLDKDPIAPLAVHLILALPRPKMLKRILQTISAMGVKQLSLIHSAKVEKSFWQTPWLEIDKLQQNLILGLEQAKDTKMPIVTCYPRFKPFVEDVLPELITNSRAIIAHPGQGNFCQKKNTIQPITLAIGPEGGFTDYEVDKFKQAGFIVCHLGQRILRVENAIPVLLGRFYDE